MSELRQDPITHDWVIINVGRAARPHDTPGASAANCPFCPGNEALTPANTDAICAPDGSWLVRAIPNRFPVLSADATEPPSGTHEAVWQRRAGYGHHEVIVESPAHDTPLGMTH